MILYILYYYLRVAIYNGIIKQDEQMKIINVFELDTLKKRRKKKRQPGRREYYFNGY